VSIFGKLTGALVGSLFGPFGILMGVILGHLADVAWERDRGGAFGGETREFVVRLFALWGNIVGFAGGLNQVQGVFLQSILTNQLALRGPDARVALAAFDEALRASLGRSWGEVLTDTSELAREIHDDFFLDRRTLIWIYATCRRIAALGTIRPGIVELLDTVAKAFSIFEEVGTAGVESSSRNDQYEQSWQNFRPASSAGPEAYTTLGLTPEATVDEIKKTYRALVRQHHPDAHSHLADGDPQKKKASERFLQVQQAYERIRQARKF
jgi:DnaJ like chaperone protein